MTAAKQDHAAPLGWLDGFSDRDCRRAGHVAIMVNGVWALVWPAAQQGDMAAMSERLLLAGANGRILPARFGQRIWSKAAASTALQKRHHHIRQSLAQVGHLRQLSLVVPASFAKPAERQQGLRAKYAAQQTAAKAMNAALAPLQPILKAHAQSIVSSVGPQRSGARSLSLHLLIDRDGISAVQKHLANDIGSQSGVAIVGPLPPFAFAPTESTDQMQGQ
ncbi:MAG: hypothetical protein AAF221_05940 [Pseudomonadota bacterium]